MPSLNYLMNEEAVYRTAPATPGLLTIIFPSCKPRVLPAFLGSSVLYSFTDGYGSKSLHLAAVPFTAHNTPASTVSSGLCGL